MTKSNLPSGNAARAYASPHDAPRELVQRAKDRIRMVMRRHQNTVVAWSGGKDSTLLMELALEIAEETGRGPLPVLWLDTEAEYAATVSLARRTAERPEVLFHWLQEPVDVTESDVPGAPLPFRTWTLEPPFRERERRSDTPDLQGHNYFNQPGDDSLTVFSHAAAHLTGGPAAVLDAQRSEEGPVQLRSTSAFRENTDSGIPWSWREPGGNFRYAPIHEWTAGQVWSEIARRGVDYNAAYDRMAQLGVPAERARVGTLYRHVMTRAGLLHLMDSWAYGRLEAQLPGLREIPKTETYSPDAAELDHREG